MLARATGWPCHITTSSPSRSAVCSSSVADAVLNRRASVGRSRSGLLAHSRRVRAGQRAAGDVADVEERVGAARHVRRRTTRSRERTCTATSPTFHSERGIVTSALDADSSSAHSSDATRPSADRTADISTAGSDTPTTRSMSGRSAAAQADAETSAASAGHAWFTRRHECRAPCVASERHGCGLPAVVRRRLAGRGRPAARLRRLDPRRPPDSSHWTPNRSSSPSSPTCRTATPVGTRCCSWPAATRLPLARSPFVSTGTAPLS